ncbi:MAG: GAF domain-containing protein [Terriglobales bacterium]
MDRSTLRLPDPVAGAPSGQRRRSVRQKLNTPVYASFNGPQPGMVVDLSELLDLNEDGFAVQACERLEVNRAVSLCLDLPETKSYIHGSGQVIWSDDTGRGGIRFSGLPESSRKILKEWLFANLLIACSNHAARTEQLARREDDNDEENLSEPAPVANSVSVVPISDQREILSRVETGLDPSQTRQALSLQVEALRREVRDIDNDIDAVLQLITERALSLTGASGAALAFLTDDKMICRARAGDPAPPLGAPVDLKQGLSGECVRSGLLVSCEDAENDSRVDPEVCRTLGIGSLMAAPIVSDFRVVGLLEIFSPHLRGFTKAHETVLDRLVEMIPKAHREKTQPESIEPDRAQPEALVIPEAVSGVPQPPASGLDSMESGSSEPGSRELSSSELSSLDSDSIELSPIHATRESLWEAEPEVREQVSQPIPGQIVAEQAMEPVAEPAFTAPSNLLHWALLGLAILVVAMALGYLVGSMMEKRWAGSSPASQLRSGAEPVSGQSATDHSSDNQRSADQRAPAKSLADLRTLADQGDADAQWQMGVRYHNAEDVPHDDAQAMKWFLLAAEQGNVAAQSALGAYYWAGRGVPEDLSQAYFWSTIALANGDENSKVRLEGLASQMTHAQVSAARQQAEVWIRTHTQRAKSEAN